MMRSLTLATLLLATALCGCTTNYHNFSHPGYGQAEFDQDQYQCQRENSHEAIYASGYVGGGYEASGGTVVDRSMVRSCLSALGWRPVKSEGRLAGAAPAPMQLTPAQDIQGAIDSDWSKGLWWGVKNRSDAGACNSPPSDIVNRNDWSLGCHSGHKAY
jgi:hypothetical protein